MTPEQHAFAKQLFNEVSDCPAEDQRARLHALTGDADMRNFVTLLLQQTQTDHPRVSQPVMRVMSAVAGSEIKVGDTLGAWKLVSEIGQGGMGTVFRAARSDGHFEQEAAVKLIHGIPSAKALEYLARERQILATLTHPNIARLYDGGATPHGQPYLVMEYVEGIAIDRYVRDNHLSVTRILKLMLAVCDAISFAHQRLIVHCDIKPSNILVTPSERPMLLDFGIARLIGTDLIGVDAASEPQQDAPPSQASSKLTQARAFTPQYASPEQRSGQALTTATDVYSLGKMLAELVQISAPTGKPDAELAAIVNKATQDDIASRYATVAALANDIHRYLDQLPLAAIEAAPVYLARKFAQRNWPWLAAAAAFLFTIGLAAQRIVSERDLAQIAQQVAVKERDATQLARAEALRERDGAELARTQAERERDRAAQAEQVAAKQRDNAKASEASALRARNQAQVAEQASGETGEFLISIFENTTPSAQSRDVAASTLLAKAETRLEQELRHQPRLQAELFHTLGVVQKNMVAYPKSIALHQRAIALERKNNRPLVLAKMLFQLVTSLHFANIHDASYGHALEALHLRQKHLPPNAIDVGLSLSQVGNQHSLRSRFGEAKPYLQQGLDILDKADPNSEYVAYALVNFAYYHASFADYVNADAMIRRAVAIRMNLYGELHELTLRASEQMGTYLHDAGKFSASATLARQNLAARITLYENEDNIRVAGVLRQLGDSLNSVGKISEAITVNEKGRAIIANSDSKATFMHVSTLQSLARARDAAGERETAISNLKEAQTYLRNLGASRLLTLARHLRVLGDLLNEANRFDEAFPLLQEALSISQARQPPSQLEVAHSLVPLLKWAGMAGKPDAADDYHKQLKPLLSLLNTAWQARYQRALAHVAETRGNVDEALQSCLAAEALEASAALENTHRRWLQKIHRAALLKQRDAAGDRAASVTLAKEILKHVESEMTPQSPGLIRVQQLATP